MHILEITIQRQTENRWPVVIEHRTPNNLLVYRNGDLQLDDDRLLTQLLPQDYGQVLGKALFHGAVRDTFVQALKEAGDNYLRVLLHVESERLRPLRWERLSAPFATGWDMLLLNQRALFAHYLPSLTERRFRPFGRRDLRALVLVASPNGLAEYKMTHFDAPATARCIQDALGEIPCDLLVNDMPEAVGPATLKALARRLTAQRYTLVHFVAHGQFNRISGDTALFLADEQNQLDRVNSEEMLDQLRALNPEYGFPHFAFLGTCESAAPEAENVMGGLAQRLVRDLGMPAVLAMTEQVSITTLQVLTTEFYKRLRQHGEADRALVEATTTIDTPHHDITVPALYTRLEGRPLFSDDVNRPLTEKEILHGLDRMATVMEERAPVLVKDFRPLAQELKLDPMDDLKLAPINQLCQDTLDIEFPALALDLDLPAYDPRCPFQGLAAFNTKDKAFFFGRDDLVEELIEHLQNHPFLAVSGPSGSGKSSLILAGVVPALQDQKSKFTSLAMTPGTTPLQTLDSLLTKNANPNLLFIDQFEELFTLSTDEDERDAFVQRLLALSELANGPTIILALRDDFWTDSQAYPQLYALMEEHRRQITPMPANLGLRFEAGLSNMLLDDVADEPGAMPLLQHGLKELWQHRHGRWLRLSEYENIGGVQQAIARTAERIYNGCTSSEKALMENVMVRLVRLEEDTPADAQPRDTRRRALRSELTPLDGDEGATRSLVARLADESLVVTKQNPATGQDEVEIAHEALIGYWGRLRDWLRGNRETLLLRQGISNGARAWRESGRDRSLLYRGPVLSEAHGLSQQEGQYLNHNDFEFIQRSQQNERRRRLTSWLVPAGAVAGVALLVLFGLWLFAPPTISLDAALPNESVMSVSWVEGRVYAGMEKTNELKYRLQNEETEWITQTLGGAVQQLVPDNKQEDGLYILLEGAGFVSRLAGQNLEQIEIPFITPQGFAASPNGLYIGSYTEPGIYICENPPCTEDMWRRIDGDRVESTNFLGWDDDSKQLLIGTDDALWIHRVDGEWHSEPTDSYVSSAILHKNTLFIGSGDGIVIVYDNEKCVFQEEYTITTMALFEQIEKPLVIAGTEDGRLFWWYADTTDFCLQQAKNIIEEIDFELDAYISEVGFEPEPPYKLWVSTEEGLYSGKTQEWMKHYGQQ